MSVDSPAKHLDKIPPQNIEAEMATLGAMLIDEKVIPEILEFIDQSSFYREEHKIIFESIVSLFDARKKIDILTISEDLGKKKLLEKVNAYWIEVGKREIELGVDAILLTDDLAYHSGPYLSPHHMEEFIWPTFRKRVEAFHKIPIMLHTDGNINTLLDRIVELGLNGIHALEPTAGMDIGKIKREYGDRLVLLGNIDCGELLTHGSEAQVAEVVRKTIAEAAPGGGYVLSTSNGVHRGVRIPNLLAMVRACQKYGKYPIKS